MKLGVFTPVFAHLSTTEMIAKVKSLRHVEAVELGTGGWPGRAHLDDLTDMIEGHCRATTYRKVMTDAGLTISALSCHSNPLHPGSRHRPGRRRAVPADGAPCGKDAGADRGHVLGMPRRF